MADPNLGSPGIISYLLGAVQILWLLLLGRTNSKADDAHKKIDSERAANENRTSAVYDKISEVAAKIDNLKTEIKKDLEVRMTEPHIKEHVALSIVPLSIKIDAIHTDLKMLIGKNVK